MPAVSQAQAGLMGRKCSGASDEPKSMTRQQACEYVRGQDVRSLPKRKHRLSAVRRPRK